MVKIVITFYRGKNRIFYKATAFADDVTVTGKIILLDLTVTDDLPFVNVSDGIYALDYTFAVLGRYACIIFEDGAVTSWESIRVF